MAKAARYLNELPEPRQKEERQQAPHNESTERCLFLDTVSQPWDFLPDEITV